MSSKAEEADLLDVALSEEFGEPVETPEVDETPATDEPEVKDESEEKPAEDETKTEEPEAPETPTDEPEKVEEPEPAPKDEPEEKPSSKEDIKAALRELDLERQQSVGQRNALRDEIRTKLHPEGLEKPIVDSANNPIGGPDDMVGKLIDPDTGEPFERSAAERWWNTARAEQDKLIESIEQDIDQIAETNQTLLQEYQIVQAKYGEFLEKNPEIAQNVLSQWERTLNKDEATGIVVKAPVSLVGYYDTVLNPYMQMTAQEAKKEAAAKAKAAQADRSDLGPTSGKTESSKKDNLDKAFDAYFG